MLSYMVSAAQLRHSCGMGSPVHGETFFLGGGRALISHIPRCLRILQTTAGSSIIQESIDDLVDNRPPEAMFVGEAIVIHTFELIEVVFD